MPIRSIPSTFTGEQRRRVPYRAQAGACSLKVPLFTDNPKGEWVEGLIRVPASLAHAKPDTNEKHSFDRIVSEQLRAWEEWRAKRGWKMVSPPQVRGPFDPPSKTTKDHPMEGDVVWYFAIARFHRETPIWMGLDDVLYQRDQMKLFGITPGKDPLPWNDVSGTADTGWVDPLKYAEEQRQKLGWRRKDYLIPALPSPESLEAIRGS